MHVLVTLEGAGDPLAFARLAAAAGVAVYPVADYYLTEPPPGASFVLGYSSLSEEGLREGIRRLARLA
jgi:GntR family transcriptional regulator/MocR family aminotransferase